MQANTCDEIMEDADFYSEESLDDCGSGNMPTEVNGSDACNADAADAANTTNATNGTDVTAAINATNADNDESPPGSQSSGSIPLCTPLSGINCSQASNASQDASGRQWDRSRNRIINSITDARRNPLRLERFFHAHDLMVPKDKDLDSIEANEKSWAMVRPSGPSVTDGISWSFVDICSGLSRELLKVCHFFDVMNGFSNHHPWNDFVVPTMDISDNHQSRSLRLKYNKKDIIGVIDSKYVENSYNLSLGSSNGKGVDTAKLLQASEMNASGTQNTLLPLFKIQLNFTAGFFTADPLNSDEDGGEGEERQATFGVVTITTLRNVDSLKLIVVIV
jgi:hypothetical protein